MLRLPAVGTRCERVFRELRNGPATSRDIADSLGIPADAASAYLTDLRRRGLAKSRPGVATGGRGRPAQIFEATR